MSMLLRNKITLLVCDMAGTVINEQGIIYKSIGNTLSISIQLSNIKIYIINKNIIRASFTQRFKSNKFSDVGLKELVWKKDTEAWKIIKETWKPR